MYPEIVTERELSTVPLQNAVFCVNCEIISNSRHDICTVCGSRSLIGLFRVLGGTLRPRKPGSLDETSPKKVRYNLELAVKAFEVAARDLNQAIESITHLTNVGGELECLHISIESVEDGTAQGFLRAA